MCRKKVFSLTHQLFIFVNMQVLHNEIIVFGEENLIFITQLWDATSVPNFVEIQVGKLCILHKILLG